MNERIKQLAEEHGFIHEYMTIGERNDALTKYRKFAELIVQECIDTVSDCSIEYCTRPQIVNELKEHFGVEE